MRTILTLVALFVASPAVAAPHLIAEFHYDTGPSVFGGFTTSHGTPRPVPDENTPFFFDWNSNFGGFSWFEHLNRSVIGQERFAPPEVVARFASLDLSNPFMVHYFGPVWTPPVLEAGCRGTGCTVDIHLPLDALPITAISRTVHRMDIVIDPSIPTNWLFSVAETIRVYGEAVPEPSTWLLVAAVALVPIRMRGRF